MAKPWNPQWGYHGEDGVPKDHQPADKGQCSVVNSAGERCDRPAHTMGFCSAHYQRAYQYGDVMADKPLRVLGKNKGKPCKHPGCPGSAFKLGYCRVHYDRNRWNHDMNKPLPNGPKEPYVDVGPVLESPITNARFREWWNGMTALEREIMNARMKGEPLVSIGKRLHHHENTIRNHSSGSIRDLGLDPDSPGVLLKVAAAYGYNQALDDLEAKLKGKGRG